MFADLLTRKLLHIGPEAKFLLLALALHFRGRTPEPVSIEDLARQLVLPLRDVSKALAELVEVSLLTTHQDATRRGRPKRIFEINQACVKKYEIAEGSITNSNLELAQYVITAESIKAEMVRFPSQSALLDIKNKPEAGDGIDTDPLSRAGKLSLANRLLLAVLLSRSDEFGVVSDLGRAELCALVGLQFPSLPQRLRRLVELGFIRRHVPGIASPVFSEKLKSIYILNLNHQQISPSKDCASVLLHQKPDSDDEFGPSQGIWLDVDNARKHPALKSQTPWEVIDLILRLPKHALEQIEFFLCKCARDFLSLHWNILETTQGAYKASRLMNLEKRFVAFFREPMVSSKTKEPLDGQEVLRFFIRVVIEFSMDCRRRFSDLNGVDLSGQRFLIAPADLNVGYRYLAVLVKLSAEIGQGCYWFTEVESGDVYLAEFERESDIPIDIRRSAGLLASTMEG